MRSCPGGRSARAESRRVNSACTRSKAGHISHSLDSFARLLRRPASNTQARDIFLASGEERERGRSSKKKEKENRDGMKEVGANKRSVRACIAVNVKRGTQAKYDAHGGVCRRKVDSLYVFDDTCSSRSILCQ